VVLPDLPMDGYVDHLTPVVLTAMNTGMRRGELLSMTWADINWEAKMLTIQAENAKSSMCSVPGPRKCSGLPCRPSRAAIARNSLDSASVYGRWIGDLLGKEMDELCALGRRYLSDAWCCGVLFSRPFPCSLLQAAPPRERSLNVLQHAPTFHYVRRCISCWPIAMKTRLF